MSVAVKIGHTEANHMAVDELVSFFELDLVRRAIAHGDGAIKRGLSLSLDDIISVIGFVDENFDGFSGNLDDAAADGEKLMAIRRV
jgi:hypothetical protein